MCCHCNMFLNIFLSDNIISKSWQHNLFITFNKPVNFHQILADQCRGLALSLYRVFKRSVHLELILPKHTVNTIFDIVSEHLNGV